MKIYLTATSRTTSKGIGDDKCLTIELKHGNKRIAQLTYTLDLSDTPRLYMKTPLENKEIKLGLHKAINTSTELSDICSNCGDRCHLLADMIAEDGKEIHLCESCLRDSE